MRECSPKGGGRQGPGPLHTGSGASFLDPHHPQPQVAGGQARVLRAQAGCGRGGAMEQMGRLIASLAGHLDGKVLAVALPVLHLLLTQLGEEQGACGTRVGGLVQRGVPGCQVWHPEPGIA